MNTLIIREYDGLTERRVAVYSGDEQHRYRLSIEWDRGIERLVWVTLNPSTATERKVDPTIRRCKFFAKAWGFGGVEIANLFTYRSKDPMDLERRFRVNGFRGIVHRDFRDGHIRSMLQQTHHPVMAAWGAHRMASVEHGYLDYIPEWECLGTTKSGAPKHPLYIASSTGPTLWAPR